MSRYIDADLIRYDEDIPGMFIASKTRINNMPTADVRENVRGEWLSGDCMGASCSKCGEYFSFRTFSEVYNFNFCPNCGADMRGDNNDQ